MARRWRTRLVARGWLAGVPREGALWLVAGSIALGLTSATCSLTPAPADSGVSAGAASPPRSPGLAASVQASPAVASPPATAPAPLRRRAVYVASQASSLSALARWFALDVAELAAANRIDPDATIKPGVRLVLPDGTWSEDWRLRLVAPRPGERLHLPVRVEGSVAQSGDPLEVVLRSRDGRQIALATVAAPAPPAEHHVRFAVHLAGKVEQLTASYLDLSIGAAPDGPALRVPVIVEP